MNPRYAATRLTHVHCKFCSSRRQARIFDGTCLIKVLAANLIKVCLDTNITFIYFIFSELGFILRDFGMRLVDMKHVLSIIRCMRSHGRRRKRRIEHGREFGAVQRIKKACFLIHLANGIEAQYIQVQRI